MKVSSLLLAEDTAMSSAVSMLVTCRGWEMSKPWQSGCQSMLVEETATPRAASCW